MNCFTNIERITYPSELVISLTKLYQFKGKDFYYEDVLKNYMDLIIKTTIENEAINFAKLLNLNVTENRIKLVVKKNSEPKTKDEKILKNLKKVFKIVQDKGTDLEITSNEFLHLAYMVYDDVEEIKFNIVEKIEQVNLLETKKRVSKRDILDEEINDFIKAIKEKNVEITQAITNFYVDLLHLNLFNDHNDTLALLIMYCLLFKQRFNVFKYISFFELYNKNKDKFELSTVCAGYNWETGYSQTALLNKDIIDLLLKGYGLVEKLVDDANFDKRLKKIDNVESVIMKLGEVFTREQIKNAVPQLSDSTINRALQKLKDEGKIRPNGTGRSATWIRLVPEEMFTTAGNQMNIFDFIKPDN